MPSLSLSFPRFLSPLTILRWRGERRPWRGAPWDLRDHHERIVFDGNFSKDNEFCLEPLERGNPSFIINTGLEEESCRLFRRNNVSSGGGGGLLTGLCPPSFFPFFRTARARFSLLTDFDDILPAPRCFPIMAGVAGEIRPYIDSFRISMNVAPLLLDFFFFYFNPRFFHQDCLYLL